LSDLYNQDDLRVGTRVYSSCAEDEIPLPSEIMRGVIVERYRGPKEGMKGRLRVKWDDGCESWEYGEELNLEEAA
jgi:hypothetical protein